MMDEIRSAVGAPLDLRMLAPSRKQLLPMRELAESDLLPLPNRKRQLQYSQGRWWLLGFFVALAFRSGRKRPKAQLLALMAFLFETEQHLAHQVAPRSRPVAAVLPSEEVNTPDCRFRSDCGGPKARLRQARVRLLEKPA